MCSGGSDVVTKEGEGSDREDEWMRDMISAIDDNEVEESAATTQELPQSSGSWSGFKIVGDNVDKTVHASFQRSDDNTTRSLHHFHLYAVKDRVDFSSLSDSPPPPPESIDYESLLPSESDIAAIKEEMAVLLSR